MPRSSKPIGTIRVPVFAIGKKTASGNMYPESLFDRMMADIKAGHKYSLEEVSPIERQLKKIPPFESWTEHSMAESIDADIENGLFYMTFAVKGNRFGKLLMTTIESSTIDGMEFFPVGIGNTDSDGTVTDYKLSYVTFEIKKDAS